MTTYVFSVETRIAAYSLDHDDPVHVFAAVSGRVRLDQLDNSQHTIDAFAAATEGCGREVMNVMETVLHDELPPQVEAIDNVLDVNTLRAIIAAVDAGQARIVASSFSQRPGEEPVWYCLKVQKL